MARIDEIEEIEEIKEEIINQESKIPQKFDNLFELIKLKILAKAAGIKSMVVKDVLSIADVKVKKLYIEFDHVLTKEESRKIVATNGYWYFGNMLVRIDLEKLGSDWLRKLENLIEDLAK